MLFLLGVQVEIKKHKEAISLKTRSKILKAAAKIFNEQGFAGTSLADIAKKIDINQSLIYHYYENKAELWEAVKQYVLQDYLTKTAVALEGAHGLHSFLKGYCESTIDFFGRHPEIVRMLSWQGLERINGSGSVRADSVERDTLVKRIQELQHQGKIRPALDAQIVAIMIQDGILAAFWDEWAALDKDSAFRLKYVEMMIHYLERALKP